jgi:hypothetical protein
LWTFAALWMNDGYGHVVALGTDSLFPMIGTTRSRYIKGRSLWRTADNEERENIEVTPTMRYFECHHSTESTFRT